MVRKHDYDFDTFEATALTSKKMFVIRLLVWISGSLGVILVNLSLYKVAMPLKCQQNVFVNLETMQIEYELNEIGKEQTYIFRLFNTRKQKQAKRNTAHLLQQAIGFINRTVMIFN